MAQSAGPEDPADDAVSPEEQAFLDAMKMMEEDADLDRGWNPIFTIVGMLILAIGSVGLMVGGIWLVVEAFRESLVWGFLVLFVPFAPLVFIIMNWNRAAPPFAVSIMSGMLCGMGFALTGMSFFM